MVNAHAQTVPIGSFEIRVGGNCWTYGQAYDWCCIAKPLGPATVELSLVTAPPIRAQAWAIVQLLRSRGYRKIIVRRIVAGQERLITHWL